MKRRRLGFRLAGKSVFALMVAIGCGGAAGGAPGAEVANAQKASPKGAKVYAAECAGCHGKNGEGIGTAPQVMGGASLSEYKTAAQLFDYVKSNMPLPKNRVGSLSDEQYWAVTEYMTAAHGKSLPEGGLNAENAASVTLSP